MNHKKELKKIINEELDPVLAKFGFKRVVTSHNVVYRLEKDGKVAEVFYHIYDTLTFGMTNVHMHFPEVENIILEVRLPNKNLTYYISGEEKLKTIQDVQSPSPDYPTEPITDEKYTEQIVWEVKQYMQQYGMPFIEHYSYLPNVLKEMDRLESDGKDWNNLLTGRGDRLFRGILISKLCNDKNYGAKLDFCDMKFSTVKLLEPWQPYYNKLKGVLATLEPNYPYYQ